MHFLAGKSFSDESEQQGAQKPEVMPDRDKTLDTSDYPTLESEKASVTVFCELHPFR